MSRHGFYSILDYHVEHVRRCSPGKSSWLNMSALPGLEQTAGRRLINGGLPAQGGEEVVA